MWCQRVGLSQWPPVTNPLQIQPFVFGNLISFMVDWVLSLHSIPTHLLCSYTLMLECWDANPQTRPSFADMVVRLDSLLESVAEYLDISILVTDDKDSDTGLNDWWWLQLCVLIITEMCVFLCSYCTVKMGSSLWHSLTFWLQMSGPITHMDTDSYTTVHHRGTSYFHPAAHLMCFVHSFKRNDELSFIVIITYMQCNYICPGV